MSRLRELPYLPTFLVGVVILVVAYLADVQNDQMLQHTRWERVASQVDALRSRIERRLDRVIQTSYQLSNRIEPVNDLLPAEFGEKVVEAFGGQSEVVLVELAPGFVTRLVHPLPGNESRLGRDLRDSAGTVDGSLTVRSSFSATILGPVRRDDGAKILVLRVPILTARQDTQVVEGVLSVEVDIDEVLRQSGVFEAERELDIAITYADNIGGLDNLVYGTRDIAAELAVSSEVALSSRNWTILARPHGGWAPGAGEKLPFRIGLLLLGALLLAPVLLANRFAVARRDTIQELEAIEDNLTGVIRNLPGAVFSYTMPPGHTRPGPEDRVEFFNKSACEEIWGVPAAAVEAHVSVFWSMSDDAEKQRELELKMSGAALRLEPYTETMPIRAADGTAKWIQARGHPTRLADGSTRLFTLVVDVTADVERTAELERQQELTFIAQKNDSIGKLTGGVAHDFNNLLAVIMGNQELLREELLAMDPPRTDLLDFVDSSVKATRRGADLTRNMLAFAGRARLEPALLDINDIVRETSAWAGRTLPESIDIETILEKNLALVRIDRGSAESALLNLIINARDAMPDGGRLYIETFGLELDATHPYCSTRGLAPGPYVEMVVRDTGKGIAPDALPRIFEPFFTTKPPSSGAGLGLSMVHGFMEQSGGTVIASSELGEGTTFRLFFRAAEEAAPGPEAEHVRAVPTGPGEARILLAEDEDDVRRTLVTALCRAGYDVTEAPSGDAAFEAFKRSPEIDLLLTDIVMPGKLQGTDLARAVRCMSPDLPVVFLSGYAAGAVEVAGAAGAGEPEIPRLNKPVSRDDLVLAVESALGRGHDP